MSAPKTDSAIMRAVRQHEFGEAEVLTVEEAAVPEPGEGQVRVRVHAAGVHAVDIDIRRGEGPPSMPRPDLPMTPGREIAGIVDQVGSGVDAALIGARVVVHVGFINGGYAEYALAPAESLHVIPDAVGFSQAVAAIGTGRTAQLVLAEAKVQQDDVVIIPGASGGLGSQLAQLVVSRGATAVALYGGDAKREVVERLAPAGDRFIALDAADDQWASRMAELLGERRPTLLIDGVGGTTSRIAFEALARGGRVVIIGWSSGDVIRLDAADIVERSLAVSVPLGRPVARLRDLETAALDALADGRVDPPVDEFPLARAAEAHLAIEQRRQRGKVVLIP